MKKFFSIFLVVLSLALLAACSKDPVITVNETENEFTMIIGDEREITATVNTDDALVWETSNDKIVTVTDGKIKAVSVGEATVTVSVSGKEVSKSFKITVKTPDPVSVVISGAMQIAAGETLQLTAKVLPSLASQNVTWSSEDDNIASVDTSGKVTAKQPGTVKIYAAATDTVKNSVTIEVIAPDPNGITISGSETVYLGEKATYVATVTPNLASQEIKWSVNNTEMATISETGELTPLQEGTIKVTATSKIKGSVKGEILVTISKPAITALDIEGPEKAFVGDVNQYTIKSEPQYADTSVTWSVSDTSLATIDNTGKLTGLKDGTVTITATSKENQEITKEMTITIEYPALTSLAIEGKTTIIKGTQNSYTAVPTPAFADGEVTWSTSDASLATISEDGVLSALLEGSVKVIATSKENNQIKAELDVLIIVANKDLLLDQNLTGETGTTVTYMGKEFKVGINAFKSYAEMQDFLTDVATIYVAPGTYDEEITITKDNINIYGPNFGISAYTEFAKRTEEAIFTKVIHIDNTVGFTVDGIALSSKGQIFSNSVTSKVTIKNVYTFDSNIDASQGVVYINPNSSAAIENVEIYDSYFNDSKGTGYRGIRIFNSKDSIIRNNKFYGFFDSIRYEVKDAYISGYFIVENNTFEMNVQYPLWVGDWSCASMEINGNYFGFDPAGTGTFGAFRIYNFHPQEGVKSVLNIQNNYLPYHAAGYHDFRVYSNGATKDQLEININYNTFCQIPGSGDDGVYLHIIDGSTPAADFRVNGKYNIFNYEAEVKASYFSSNVDYQPFYRNGEEINSLFVNPEWTSKQANETFTFNDLDLTFGVNAFATITDALAKDAEEVKILLVAGEYTENITISKNNVTLTSYNGLVNPNTEERSVEAIFKGKITIKAHTENFVIRGLMFTENAQIVNEAGEAATSGTVKNLDGFTFENNIVETGLTSGKGFIYFTEAASSYSYNLVFKNNSFKTTADTTTLESVVYIDNNTYLTVVGNVFKDIKASAFFINDKTKGLSGDSLIANNVFENIDKRGFSVNWYSPLPSTTLTLEVVNNTFKNVKEMAVYIGSLNASDVIEGTLVQYNTFEQVNIGITFDCVHPDSATHANYNIFKDIATTYYIQDLKGSSRASTLDATNNLYLDNGAVITPSADKFAGSPEYTTTYTSIDEVPTYKG